MPEPFLEACLVEGYHPAVRQRVRATPRTDCDARLPRSMRASPNQEEQT
jgi:hypothetical protein